MTEFVQLMGMGFQCSFLILLSPIGWLLIAVAGICGRGALREKRWPFWTWSFLSWPLIMSGVCVAWGMTHAHQGGRGTVADEGPAIILNLLMAVYLAGGLAAVFFNRSGRAATAAVLSLGSFLFLGCAFVAAMSVTGDWL